MPFPKPVLPDVTIAKLPDREFGNGVAVRVPDLLESAVHTIPALAGLKASLPRYCGLAVVCHAALLPIFSGCPCVDAVIPLQNPRGGFSAEEMHMLRSLRMGAGVIFRASSSDVLAFRRAGIRHLAGLRCLGSGLLTQYSFPVIGQAADGKAMHRIAYYSGLVCALGAKEEDCVAPAYPDELFFNCAASSFSAILRHPRMLLCSLGGYGPYWPESYIYQAAKAWIAKGGIVCGIPATASGYSSQAFQGLDRRKITVFGGGVGTVELMRLLKSARAILGGDDGIIQLGAALGGSGCALFGYTDPYRSAPTGEKWHIFQGHCDNGPCNGDCRCKGEHYCLSAIQPEAVSRALLSFF